MNVFRKMWWRYVALRVIEGVDLKPEWQIRFLRAVREVMPYVETRDRSMRSIAKLFVAYLDNPK